MASTFSISISPIIVIVVVFIHTAHVSPTFSLSVDPVNSFLVNQTIHPAEKLRKVKWMKAHLKNINKTPIKTIKSPDGDLIDCVVSHQQPAFDHPKLKGKRPMTVPERPKGYDQMRNVTESFQLWRVTGESCPEGTVPIRRTRVADVLRSSSIARFGGKRRQAARGVLRDLTSNGHEHAVGYVVGDQFYGAKASLNVWAPHVDNPSEFSLSQVWVISGTFSDDLNTIEAGWQVSPELYGDSYPRFFTYWTSDDYESTGCYNLLCSGFVQTNNEIAIGAAINPTSTYKGSQFDITLLIWKDPTHGHWWLELGPGILIGYWPSFLFSHLSYASMVQFGGEVVNTQSSGLHTRTQMGSGHLSTEGLGKSAYFRNLQVVDWDNNLVSPTNLVVLTDNPSCYDIHAENNSLWGNYFYYGGPGRNVNCP